MRISSTAFSRNLDDQLRVSKERYMRAQAQVSSGQKVTLPEDAPLEVGKLLELNFQKSLTRQYYENAENAEQWNQSSFDAVKQLQENCERVSVIISENGRLTDQSSMKAFAKELTGLVDHSIQLLNSKNIGNSLFAGARLNDPAVVSTFGAGNVVTQVAYQGNGEMGAIKISEATQINLLLSPETCQKFTDFINHVIALRDAFEQSPPAYDVIDTQRQLILVDEDVMIQAITELGAVSERLDHTKQSNRDYYSSIEESVSGYADVDITDAVLRLNNNLDAYDAAIRSGYKIMGLTAKLLAQLQ